MRMCRVCRLRMRTAMRACTMATTQELKTALRETLESRGVLGQLKAQIRAEVYKTLDNEIEESPQLSDENVIINALIKEYLQFNGYNYTCSVFQMETPQLKKDISTEFLAQELSLPPPNGASVPLLYQMVARLKGSGSLPSKPRPPENTHHQGSQSLHHHGSQTPTNEDADHSASSPATVVIQGLK